ncbi:hypothetical protein ACFWY6_41525 [Streptomyces sp. NPDC059037]|uniref:hypothetical protein n=1 Tax=Streptomyces sp. NPDC059037 TaxID=3346710 RepID=UPI003675685B
MSYAREVLDAARTPLLQVLPPVRVTRPPLGDDDAVEQVRSGRAGAFRSVVTRHWAAVTAYVRTGVVDEAMAESLICGAFEQVFESARRGPGSAVPLRVQLLVQARTAMVRAWSHEHPEGGACPADSGGRFSSGFSEWAGMGSTWPLLLSSRLAAACRTLSGPRQTALWHSAVEREGRALTTQALGADRAQYGALVGAARTALREAYLDLHRGTAADTRAEECLRHCELLAEATSETSSAVAMFHLVEHLDRCAACTAAYADLVDLDGRLRHQLPGILLGWWPARPYAALKKEQLPPLAPPAFLDRAASREFADRVRHRKQRIGTLSTRVGVYGLCTAAAVTLGLAGYRASTSPPRDDGASFAEDPEPATTVTQTVTAEPSSPEASSPTRPDSTPTPSRSPGASASPAVPDPTPTPPARPTRPSSPVHRATGRLFLAPATNLGGTTVLPGGTGRTFTNGGVVRMGEVDFSETPPRNVALNLTPRAPVLSRTTLTLTLDDPDGPPLLSYEIPAVVDRDSPFAPVLPLPEATAATGVHTLYAKLSCSDTTAAGADVHWVRFQ